MTDFGMGTRPCPSVPPARERVKSLSGQCIPPPNPDVDADVCEGSYAEINGSPFA